MTYRYDQQNGAEGMLFMLSALESGASLLAGIGSCYNANGMSAEMMVIHMDWLKAARFLRRGLDTGDLSLALASIKRAGPGGHYLADELTLRNLRSDEFFAADLFDHTGHHGPYPSLLEQAHEKVEQMVARAESPLPGRVREDLARHFQELYRRYQRPKETIMNVLQTFSLEGRVALVTGGAGLYGRQIVEALAEAGARVFTASRNLDALTQLASTLRERGLQVDALRLDLASEESILQVRDTILDRAGRVDILVNNAVLRPMSGHDAPREEWEQSMQVNATGLFLITRAFGEVMAQAGRGSIINIGSIQGMVGPDDWLYEEVPWSGFVPDYFFHKGGMINLTRYMAAYLGPQGVRVNIISPGGFFANQEQGFLWRYERRTFLGRMANDTDLKGAVVFLASDASAYVTGANLVVDGGYTAK